MSKTFESKKTAEMQIIKLAATIKYDTANYYIKDIIDKFTRNQFLIKHRKRENWSDGDKSRFIESLLLGLPTPIMFWEGRGDEYEDGPVEIIDGAQRIAAIVDFIENNLELTNLDTLTTLNGFTFSDLDRMNQRRLENKIIRVVVLGDDTTDDVKQDIYYRFNEPCYQEMQHAALPTAKNFD